MPPLSHKIMSPVVIADVKTEDAEKQQKDKEEASAQNTSSTFEINEQEEQKKLSCEICSKIFDKKYAMLLHMRKEHNIKHCNTLLSLSIRNFG